MTPHFSLPQALYSRTAKKKKLPNTPKVGDILNIRFSANCLEQFYWLIGEITSWYRSEEVNEAVGGVPTSYHAKGLAVDFIPRASYTPQETAEILRDLQFPFLRKVIIYEKKPHVHVSFQRLTQADTKVGTPRFFRKTPAGYEPLFT